MTDYYWHFCPVDADGVPRLGHGDGREARVGEMLTVDGNPVACKHGLHASARIMDALKYAPATSALCRVTLGGTIVHDIDKYVARERTVVAMLSAAETDALMRGFARRCARQVIDLWDAPQVVRAYLETGDESLRAAVEDAAWAARDAAWAAGDAAGYAAGYAAWHAARDDAAWAARDVARAVRDAAAWAARDVARAVRDAAAWAAAESAAGYAARATAESAQNEWLTAAALRRMEAQP